jgi:anti-sigma regulatory factor (Ser/Thr protein kinase)
MEVSQTTRIEITDTSGVGHARRIASELAERLGFDATHVGRVALLVTEAATNVVKHAKRGALLLQTLVHNDARGVDVITLDRGPGINDVAAAMRDGYSTSSTPGTGIGAIARQAAAVDVHSRAGFGTVLLARVWNAKPPVLAMRVGGVSVCHPLEEICGDAWAVDVNQLRTRVMVADGLGHGPLAAEAARAACAVFKSHLSDPPVQLLERMHGALAATRGAAVATATIDADRHIVRFAGIGNIAATIEHNDTTRSAVSHHGTLGHDARRFQEFTQPFPPGALLVMHSDGIDTRWRLASSPGLALRDPTLIAATLYRDHQRGRDDATIVVLKDAA